MNEAIPARKESDESELSQELLQMLGTDQAMRKSANWNADIDARNTARLKEIFTSSGWPTLTKVGKEAAHAAWVLVQHADHDPEFQTQVLELMKNLPEGEVDSKDIAYLEDRVRINTGRETLYGTQFYTNSEGVFGPRPIEDPQRLAERRAAVGLDPFEEYEQEMHQHHQELERRK